jgi:transcriptional regulator with XRE-family HTH domain
MSEQVTTDTLGPYIRQLREERGLTQEELAKAIGKTQKWTSDIERGKYPHSTPETLRTLAAFLGVPFEDLMLRARFADSQGGAKLINAQWSAMRPVQEIGSLEEVAGELDAVQDRLGDLRMVIRLSAADAMLLRKRCERLRRVALNAKRHNNANVDCGGVGGLDSLKDGDLDDDLAQVDQESEQE